ncbi:MAG TPA: translocation/assembly module TamB domain-containing protein [Daejeonella sp.]|uniref:translocation/assembly module TamB domain-containing protein n=1 Tax=Daejeonella sp. TaxID=2805397 RepID=UPI002EDA2204
MLLTLLVFSLQFKTVQTYVAKKAASYLSRELNTRVELGSLYIKPFKSVVLDSLYIQDLEKDTLLFSPKFTVDLDYFSLRERKVSVKLLQIENGKFFLKKYKDQTTNLTFILNYFSSGKTTKKKVSKPYDITLAKIVLNNVAFKYKNFNNVNPVKGINFNDILLSGLSTTILDLDTKSYLMKAGIRNMTFREKSGFYLKNLTADAAIDTAQMEFKKLLLETSDSRISDYLLLKYSKFKDFNTFTSKVFLNTNLQNAKINSSDIAYFSPSLAKSSIILQVNGQISGYVNNLKAKSLIIQSGQATYVKGDFRITGLPSIKQMMLDLDFDQVSTNKKDLDLIISRATGKKNSMIPQMIEKFGTVNFKGRFTGFLNDFIAYGEFKTRIGRVVTDLNMKINNASVPTYSGNIKAYDFNLGDLLDQKNLGRTTLTADIEGKGFKINSLQEQIKANVKYFDFKDYRYNNIKVDSRFVNKVFNGKIIVNDPNVKLDFDGKVDLNKSLPEFNFGASILGANLHNLKLIKDSVQFDADVKTNFKGSNLENIEGMVELTKIHLTNAQNSFDIDSVNLKAIGTGLTRSLNIESDIFDASIKGQYDLKTLPSYFKSVASKYIPSLGLTYVQPGKQNFEFNLKIKYFEPLSILFAPQLKIPEQANFNGKFVSDSNTANLNGFIKLIQYNKIKVNNLIIDESTSSDAMNIFITSDRVDITDSLYIKNVNIANILKNDSLSLNVKLSDKNAINQLDLNSLVEFTSNGDQRIQLSILPSDVIINNQTWKIQEKVSFSFDDGRTKDQEFSLLRRTKITGFELFRDNQMLTINGYLSKDPADELLIGFNNFKLTTFNPLTTPLGITLNGTLNGNAKIAGLGPSPNVEAEIKIDSLIYNKLAVGNMTLSAGLDNSTKLINVKMNVENNGETTMDIAGTYNASDDQNNLDMKLIMKDNEVALFQPFLKNLVSNMNGKVSADLTVTGKLNKPQINGNLNLTDGGMTVNYLKTPYRITDKIQVENTVIKLNNLKIRDHKDNIAIANGTVDMANVNNPEIHINIVANNFMALNTTAKDNPLYFGVAYGTGVFSFNGPTNDMRIIIDAKTEAGTVFNIPLNSSATVSKTDFITFISRDTSLNKPKITSFKGLTMDFELQIDQNTEVNIFTELGKLTGRGDSQLSLNINSLGDFEMYGDYNINSGKFAFTAQDFINKIFKISEGGSIRWTGNPVEAAINLKALYEVRTSLGPLYAAAGRPSIDQRVLAEAVMNLSGPLLTPNISFDINFPADASIKDELQSYLSDVNNTNQQALSLIVRRSFAAGKAADLGFATSTFISAGTELFFNQLNTILTQSLNLNFVDLNIRSLNDASASFRFLNDRLILTGGITDRANSRGNFSEFNVIGGGNSVARDVEALYLIKKNGDLVLRASNKINSRSFLNNNLGNSEYVSAIGLVYRKDFDTFNELLGILVGKQRKEDRNKEKDTIPRDTTAALKPKEPEIK